MFKISESSYHKARDEGNGVCLSCGDLNPGAGGFCEPDAEGYECAQCGKEELMGIDDAMMGGEIEVAFV